MIHRAPRVHAILLASLVSIAVRAAAANAQASAGGLAGVATADETGTPIPFVLIKLLPMDAQAAGGRQEITNAEGRFRFASVAAGLYRFPLLRIG